MINTHYFSPFLKQKYVRGAEMNRLNETVPFEHPKHMYRRGKERKRKKIILIIITCICTKTWLPTYTMTISVVFMTG